MVDMTKYYPEETVKDFNQMLEEFRLSKQKKKSHRAKHTSPKGWYFITK